jgi:multidrug efflux pump subunit AcrB
VSEIVYKQWAGFSEEVNESTPPGIPKVVAQSRIFLDAYRTEATIDSTLTTWFVANGLCLLIILLFIQNVALSFMVMVTIVLILFCLGGLLFAVFRVPFGPVEALGVSIFIGLSANYS